jgi:glycine/D-amino acid oxidase-like deaminating enzyme
LSAISRSLRNLSDLPVYDDADSNFVIDVHLDNDRIIIASPCSGHGFKRSAAIGEALAEQVIDRKSKIDIRVSA